MATAKPFHQSSADGNDSLSKSFRAGFGCRASTSGRHVPADSVRRDANLATFIGRVGALAVALGIGGAIATNPGIACADDAPPSAGAEQPSSASNSDATSTDAPQSPSTPSSSDIGPPTGSADPTGSTPETAGSETERTLDDGVVVRSSGGAHTSENDDTTPDIPEDDAAPDPADPEEPTPPGTDDPITEDPSPRPPDATPDAVPPSAENKSENSSTAKQDNESETSQRFMKTTAADEETAPADAEDDTGVQVLTTLATTDQSANLATLSTVDTTVPEPAAPDLWAVPRAFMTMAFSMVDAVLTPFLGPIPSTPAPDTPLLWAVLGWVRRQFAEALQVGPFAPTAQVVAAAEGVHPPGEGPDDPTGLPDDLERTVLVDGLDQPTDFRFLPNGDILIAEKGGAIKLYDGDQVHGEPLITLAVLPTDTDEERGLLGIEIDPNFAQNGYIYVSYTTAQNFDRLSRLTVTGHTADPASELVLLESDQPGNIYHHGGEIHFGPDGKLYWAMGMNTNNPNSQNLSNVHGKILRINPDGTIPEDNPFVDTPGAIDAIWAYGLRNPFRFTFTPDGQLLAGDVGGDAWEELNIVTRGGNYGWPNAEGVCTGTCPYVNPIYTYAHTPPPAKAGSITGVMVYTDDLLGEQYQNKVFIADYTLGWIKELTFDSTFTSFISERMFDDQAGTTVKLMQGPDGKIYQLNIFPGTLSVIAPSGGNRAPSAVITASPDNGLSPLNISFSSAGSSDPDPNTTLTYSWDFGDGTTSTLANPTKTYTVNGPYDVTLVVSDGEKIGQATKRIVVGSTAPTAEILSPVLNSLYAAGDTISFSGLGTDAEDGDLPDSAYKWTVVFGHADHVHPFRDNIIGPTGTITLPRSADNIDTTYYRLTLTVTDSSGLSTSTSTVIKPRLVTLTINASDPDATFTVDGIPKKGSFTEQAVVGVERVIAAVSPQYVSNGQFVFNSWSDGGAQSHTIITPGANATYTINYDRYNAAPAPWQEGDIGHPTVAGYSSYDNGTFTIRAAGGDIWGPTDEFHYVHQGFNGDGTIIARVTAQTDTDDWAKSGIMIKESATAGAKYVLLAVTPENGVTFQYNFNGDGGSAPYTFPNAWLKLERHGDVFTGYASANGTDWTMVGQTTLAMNTDVTAGLAVVSHKFDTLNTSTFDGVSVISNQQWTSTDVGAPRTPGSTTIAAGVHTLKGSGDDIWGDADQFHLSYQTLPGDGQIIARVTSFTDTTDSWAKAGLIVKDSTAAGADYALLAVTPGNGINLQSGFDTNIAGPAVIPGNTWLKLERIGNTVTGFTSLDGQIWTEIGSATVDLDGDAVIGLFVSAHDGSQLSTATFDHVTVTKSTAGPASLPAPWTSDDVGAPRLAGSAAHAAGVFTVNGAGDDIWGDADQFHFVHQTLTGDGEIVARVVAQEVGTDGWAKSGIMIKQSATAGSPYALLAVTPEHGITFQHNFTGDAGSAPYALPNAWLKLARSGDTVTGYTSADGVNWTEISSVAVALAADVEVGLFVSSHNGSQINTSVFDNVAVTPAVDPLAAL